MILLLVIMCLVSIGLIGAATNKEDKLISLGLLLFIFTTSLIVFVVENDKPVKTSKLEIDLPEEHQLISHNKLKPDTLLGYYRNDTLVIEFKH